MASVEEESLTFFPSDASDIDHSFTSSASSTSFATTFSGRSSLNLPSFSSSSTLRALPHRRSDPHWSAVRAASNLSPDGALHLRHLRLLRHLGSGNLARVFHCRLLGFDASDPSSSSSSSSADFALKVVDLDAVARAGGEPTKEADDGGKLSHVQTEARVLAELDHPFLPTLYARLDASHYACFLIDYCPGGDLHSLLRRSPGHRLPPNAVRFYAAEVLLALEYLHALGFVYRDLKPENVLLRADGHVMLSDFDLCFQSDVTPALLRHRRLRHRQRRPSTRYPCCFDGAQTLGDNEEEEAEVVEFVAEPEAAYSRACVGTHEYLAPEVVNGNGHGNGVDWWAFGVFIYELLYGRTPFKGGSKEATLRNILTRELRFPDGVPSAGDDVAPAKDLIWRLLVRNPKRRMGCARGAAEIKLHPFFNGIQWSLIRCARPPVVFGPAGGALGKAAKEGCGKQQWSSWSRTTKSIVVNSNRGVKLVLGSKKKTKEKDGK